MHARFSSLLPFLVAASALGQTAGDGAKTKRDPEVAPGDSAEAALKKFSVAPGLQVDVWAAEPLLANPVAFAFDERGRAFVAETYRRRSSVPDIRKYLDWLLPALSFRSVEDRAAFLRKNFAPELKLKPTKDLPDQNGDGQFDWRDWAVESERVKLVRDSDGDGKADDASVFAEGFNAETTGVGAGVLAQAGSVWFTCIPELWRLRESGAGEPHAKPEPLHSGFGVHIAFGGHDMHGLALGPDGKLYWSIADCGAHVTTKEGRVIDTPDTGAVFRANPDGTEMELVASGLRNPQGLAFNDVGDLFTGDNNADGGDKARWVHVVEGGDSGWRIGWQFLKNPLLGAWNGERLWDLNIDRTALGLLPPVGHIGHGPAGIAWYPGTGLPEAYRGHFFYADFPGGVRSFALKPKGASYTVENPGDVLQDNTPKEMRGKLLWGLYPSDVKFGVDGGAYVLDWIQGWEKTGKGRIYRVHDAAVDASAPVLETKKLLAEGMAPRGKDELARLLGHADQRVRLAAQWALAEGGAEETLAAVAAAPTAADAESRPGQAFARLHAMWGLGQIGRKSPGALLALIPLLTDREGEVRAQAAKVLGDARLPANARRLLPLLGDPEPRVRFFAALALGKTGSREAVPPLLAMLRQNANADAYLRHAGVMGLAGCADVSTLTAAAYDASDAVRAGVLLALRRLGSPEVIAFLEDWNPQLVLEAARAIHDSPITEALPHLAAMAADPQLAPPVARRAVNANFQLGTVESARTLALLAANGKAPEPVRLDALEALAQWNEPLGRDRVLGVWRPLPAARDTQAAAAAAVEVLGPLLKDASEPIRISAAEAATSLKLSAAEPALLATANDPQASGKLRAAALRALASFSSPGLANAIQAALAGTDKTLLEEARRLSAKLSPAHAAEQIAAVLETGSTSEKQSALRTLGALPGADADKLLAATLDRLATGKVPAAIRLELLESAALRSDDAVKKRLAAYEAARPATDPLARWTECLEGGDAKAGRAVFYEKAEAACLRCHKVAGEGGDVGPDVAGIGARHDRAYLLKSIVAPNAEIAPGFESALLTLKDGSVLIGIVSAEDAAALTLTPLAGGEKAVVQKAQIAERLKVPSPMPEGLGEVLGKRDLRDVVAFLAELK